MTKASAYQVMFYSMDAVLELIPALAVQLATSLMAPYAMQEGVAHTNLIEIARAVLVTIPSNQHNAFASCILVTIPPAIPVMLHRQDFILMGMAHFRSSAVFFIMELIAGNAKIIGILIHQFSTIYAILITAKLKTF